MRPQTCSGRQLQPRSRKTAWSRNSTGNDHIGLRSLFCSFVTVCFSLALPGVLGQDLERVQKAERRENLKTCLSGRYSSLCKHDLLSRAENSTVAEAERRENLKICLSGRYSSLCKHDLPSRAENSTVAEADHQENLKICLSGRYPLLCNKILMNSNVAPGTTPRAEASPRESRSGSPAVATNSRVNAVRPAVSVQAAGGTIYLLLIYESGGLYTSTSASEERAFADLVAYVKSSWSSAFPGSPPPDDDEKLIDAYFDRKDAKEEYKILELPLLK